MSIIALLCIVCLWTSDVQAVRGPDNIATLTGANNQTSQILPARERLKRLIPYMTYYVSPAGSGQHRGIQSRPVLAVPAKDGGGGYLPFSQQSQPPPPPSSQPSSYLLPVVVPPQSYHRQPVPTNYPRYFFQQPSALTKMITQNYLAIAKQQAGNNGGRFQTRINSYSPEHKPIAIDHSLVHKQQYHEQHRQQQQPRPQIVYKQQVQDPILYGQSQLAEEDGIIYKPQAQDVSDDQYDQLVTPEPQQQQPHKVLSQIPPELLAQFKPQDAIAPPPHQYKNLIQPPVSSKQYYILRRPSTSPQHQYKDDQQDEVTITQSQEVDVSSQPDHKYHAKYVATKLRPTTISTDNYPVSYQQQEEYDTVPLVRTQQNNNHNNDDDDNRGVLDSSDENIGRLPINAEDVLDGELNNLLGGVSLSKSLPDRITPENLDSSIRTLSKLLRILQRANALPHSAKTLVSNLPRPKGNSFPVKVSKFPQKIPTTDQEGGTPGRAGIDYPAYDEIPPTHFSCREQRYKGFFGDPETGCQVWHYCDLNGGQASFLCPNGTIFSQVALTCDWWFNVKCASTAQLYVLNERLYKYILPQKLSFPEDYQGPLVDQYLEQKFKEIEEKNRNKTEQTKTSTPKEKEEELPFSEDEATSQNKVRSITKDLAA